MRIRIAHEERKSWLFGATRQIDVAVQVEFTSTERAIIVERRLEDYIVLERFPDGRTVSALNPDEFERWAPSFHLRIRHLMRRKPERFTLDSPSDAKAYQARLEAALRALKTFIADNMSPAPPSRFEL